MQQIFPDLWQTSPERPLPGVREVFCHAYLLTRAEGNVLVYATGREMVDEPDVSADLDRIEELGGVAHVLLGHWHEAAPALRTIKERFGARIVCHARDAAPIEHNGGVAPDDTFWDRETLLGDIDAIPTPGHTVGSACYQYRSSHGRIYLFSGDTIWPHPDGWTSVTFEDDGEQTAHRESLDKLATLRPDVVIAAIAPIAPGASVAEIDPADWPAATAAAKARLG